MESHPHKTHTLVIINFPLFDQPRQAPTTIIAVNFPREKRGVHSVKSAKYVHVVTQNVQ